MRIQDFSWGASSKLKEAILRKKPKVHLFGHLHEQCGYFLKTNKGFVGGVEARLSSGQIYKTLKIPDDYPCQLISNNAMKDWGGNFLQGPPRLIHAHRRGNGNWTFEI